MRAPVGKALLVAVAPLVAAALLSTAGCAGCSDSCPTTSCSPPVFDLAMGRMDDLRATRDLTITSAGVVMVGAGATNAFSPSTVTIQAGQSVTWNWVTGFHSVVSDSTPKAFADSPAQSAGQFTVTFATAGTYPYHCGIHGAMMSGTVVAQ
ncbi:MAG TPA: plastocyanin/azurin family copper-binding protein [Polyangia bacterium]|jgi:plastocyanin|nr:plastocyanin/azurin family copper-binding protein [Polyangia bacterium]